jgi:hypothetical protein
MTTNTLLRLVLVLVLMLVMCGVAREPQPSPQQRKEHLRHHRWRDLLYGCGRKLDGSRPPHRCH